MKRIFNSLNRRAGSVSRSASKNSSTYPDDSPEGIILREVAAFCEAGNRNAQGTEFVHLPAIVESAESSPNAAKEAAHRIRKSLSDPISTAGYIHYNAIMLVRILIDNPGHTFTRNIDAKFTSTVKDLLRQGRDMGVQQFLRETLEFMETQRAWDEDLAPLVQMWQKEKGRYNKASAMSSRYSTQAQSSQQGQNFFGGAPRATNTESGTLPPPEELSARIAEARNSANLLHQLVQSTPPAEILDNELIKEFCHRCRSASRVIGNYIHSTNPAPDEDTLVTLIEANDELSVSLSKHQRAILNARKTLGNTSDESPASSGEVAPSDAARPVPAPPLPQRNEPSQPQSSPEVTHAPAPAPAPPVAPTSTGENTEGTANGPGRYEYRSEDFQVHNPFADYNTYVTTMSPAASHQRRESRDINGRPHLLI